MDIDSPALPPPAPRRFWRRQRTFWLILALLLSGPVLAVALGRASISRDWRTASTAPVGLAPDPVTAREPVVQVYAARTVGWRGAFAVHTWLAAKPQDADTYTRYEVIGWRLMRGNASAISVSDDRAADAQWFGARPELLRELRGPAAAAVIARLPQVLAAYPYADEYHAWPGPNSNTFVAYLGRELPQLELTMPSIAIGKDYQSIDHLVSGTPSHTGYQLSLYGLGGLTLARDEGLELNILGLVTGVDIQHPALKLPGLGRVPG